MGYHWVYKIILIYKSTTKWGALIYQSIPPNSFQHMTRNIEAYILINNI